jgi:hypothetical protein
MRGWALLEAALRKLRRLSMSAKRLKVLVTVVFEPPRVPRRLRYVSRASCAASS